MILTDFLSMELTTATRYGFLTLGQPNAWAYNYLGERGDPHHLCTDPAVHRYCSGTCSPHRNIPSTRSRDEYELTRYPHSEQGCNSPPLFNVPDFLSVEYLPPNLGTIAAFIYSIFYILLEPVAGGLIAPLVIGSAACGNYLLGSYGMIVNYYAVGIHIVSWLAQFVGHGKFEGRAPALLDNLVQALLLAPLFVWMEILFFFGYRRELKQRMDKNVEVEIEKFRKEKEQKKGKEAK